MALNAALNFRHAPWLHKGSRQKLRPVSLIGRRRQIIGYIRRLKVSGVVSMRCAESFHLKPEHLFGARCFSPFVGFAAVGGGPPACNTASALQSLRSFGPSGTGSFVTLFA